MERVGHRCICGCGKELFGSRVYFPGHKPKPILTSDEKSRRKSEAAKKGWDARGRSTIELHSCACGCGERVKGTWAQGHHSRVQNISKRDDVREKRRERFVQMHKEGKIKPPVLRGPDSPWWRGGVSKVQARIRSNTKLYEQWKRPVLVRDGFKCRVCESTSELVVHHDQERFAEIVRKMIFTLFGKEALERELTFEEGTHVVAAVLDYHVREKVSGITLCWKCHEDEHERDT